VQHTPRARLQGALPSSPSNKFKRKWGHFLLSKKIDTWSFGIFLFETITQTHPFEYLNPGEGFRYLRKLREALLPQIKRL
jgi:serine/threonine protein kinase